jgi:hypothetical protein
VDGTWRTPSIRPRVLDSPVVDCAVRRRLFEAIPFNDQPTALYTVDGDSGVLVQDPADLREFGEAVSTILRCPAVATRIGRCARERVADRFLATRSLMQYAEALATLGLETAAAA